MEVETTNTTFDKLRTGLSAIFTAHQQIIYDHLNQLSITYSNKPFDRSKLSTYSIQEYIQYSNEIYHNYIQTLKDDNWKLRERVEQLKNEYEDLDNKHTKLSNEKKGLDDELNTTNGFLNQCKEERTQLRKDKEFYIDKYQTCDQAFHENEERYKKLNEQNTKCEEDKKNCTEEYEMFHSLILIW